MVEHENTLHLSKDESEFAHRAGHLLEEADLQRTIELVGDDQSPWIKEVLIALVGGSNKNELLILSKKEIAAKAIVSGSKHKYATFLSDYITRTKLRVNFKYLAPLRIESKKVRLTTYGPLTEVFFLSYRK